MTPLSTKSQTIPERCIIVLDAGLAPGRAANAAAVMALTVGQRHSELVGPPLIDACDLEHPGLIPIGIAVLAASQAELSALRQQASTVPDIDIVDFPAQGQQTKDYDEFRRVVASLTTDEITYVGIALIGKKKPIAKLVARHKLYN